MCSNRPWLNDEGGIDGSSFLPNAIFSGGKSFLLIALQRSFCCYSKKINNFEGQYDLIL